MKKVREMKTRIALTIGSMALAWTGCGPAPEDQALTDVKAYVQQNLDDLNAAAVALQQAAPTPDADGWNAADDAAAVESMKAEWKKARLAYERVEGAIAVLFPELDVSTDERYDGFIAGGADDNLFDAEGVIGIHAVERILWSDSIPDSVRQFEEGLPHYKAAAFPASEAEARDFKEKLLPKLVADTQEMKESFAPLALDPAAAFRGVIGSMQEQLEKTNLAATGEEESRYAQHTLADMRGNVEGGRKIFAAFEPWLQSQPDGSALVDAVNAGLSRIDAKYAELGGDAIPPVPETWSSQNPSDADLQTPFGKLYALLESETDASREGSTVQQMTRAAEVLQIPELAE